MKQQAALEAKLRSLEGKLQAANARNSSTASGTTTGPSSQFSRLQAQGMIVDTATHCGIGKVGAPHHDVYEKSWLADQEGCQPGDRCWLPLIAHGGILMCPDPVAHGGENAPMHSYTDDLVDEVKRQGVENRAARGPPSSHNSGGKSSKSSGASRKKSKKKR